MESAILLLDDNTDQATKQMLQHVVERKRKYEALKKKHLRTIWATIISAGSLFAYLYIAIIIPYSYSFFTMFSVFVDQFAHMLFLLITAGLYGYMGIMKKKVDKAELEYHTMRKEIIHKSKELWKAELKWKNRHKVFEMMKKNYDINLYHESK
ncbi:MULTISPECIES: YpbF family protein [Bacillaceae]|uniref:DUF2663 domain-containing protein n=1 Tax=Peribacillus huizhouensis TaxID=1501239 RepID=A0ABR6CQC2_9BACI|nr:MULTISPECIES: YpbF family protein [Bacillaceae]MBA9027233.1 hypothetical protein [Peribacillus huizhouensis]